MTVGAIIGSTLIALLLTGSTRSAASSKHSYDSPALSRLKAEGNRLFDTGLFLQAREVFRTASVQARREGDYRGVAMNRNNAGACSMVTFQFRVALADFNAARQDAERHRQSYALAVALNSLASLYIHMGQFETAARIAREALAGPAGSADPVLRAQLLSQLAESLAELQRFDKAEPLYRASINGLLDLGKLDISVAALGNLGHASLHAGSLAEAEWAFTEGLRIVRTHGMKAPASLLSGLAQVKDRQGDTGSAAALFDAALAVPPGVTPEWSLRADRGRFRLNRGDLRGAVADFREARRIVYEMRADVVPADQDRVAIESGLGPTFEGLVDAGNRFARGTGDERILQETFDAAEQDRLWSLRALVPTPDDWRNKLPERYWEVLARYEALERVGGVEKTGAAGANAASLRQALQQMEASADGSTRQGAQNGAESALAHVRNVLDDGVVLFSFHISKTSSWVWAVAGNHVDVYPLPPRARLETEIAEYNRALRTGADVSPLSRQIYADLFAPVAWKYLRQAHWLLELDGPLYDLPFASLEVAGEDPDNPVYLVERAALQSVPSALLLKRGVMPADGEFLGIGDPVYNRADDRYRGPRGKTELALARLPNTLQEVRACARAWNSQHPQILTSTDARIDSVRAALRSNPAIIHFATHVVAGTGEFRSGLIALSLDRNGQMGLLGPKEIAARAITTKLVVMDGCYSAQGDALPSAGLMGLTRAWIGAGAMAVLATQWHIPDDAAQSLMTDFYGALRASPERGFAFALREAQLAALRNPQAPKSPGAWAGYSLLSRLL